MGIPATIPIGAGQPNTEILSQESDTALIIPKRIFEPFSHTLPVRISSILNTRYLTFKPDTSQVCYAMAFIQKYSTKRITANYIGGIHPDLAFDRFFPPSLRQKKLNFSASRRH